MERLRLHLVAIGIKVRQPLTGILQADAVPVRLRGNSPCSRIPHQEVQQIAIARGRCLNLPLALTTRNPVSDGILHYRLQQKSKEPGRRRRAGLH